MKDTSIAQFIKRLAKIGSLTGLSLMMVGTSFGGVKKSQSTASEAAAEEPASRMVVNVNDLQGMADFRSEDIREDLLRTAFYDAAERADWFGEYDFRYNRNAEAAVPGSLELQVLNWRRSRTGMYEFSVAVNYWNVDGEKVRLGTSYGTRLGLLSTGPRSVGDQFSASAEDAFRDTLRKLKKVVVDS